MLSEAWHAAWPSAWHGSAAAAPQRCRGKKRGVSFHVFSLCVFCFFSNGGELRAESAPAQQELDRMEVEALDAALGAVHRVQAPRFVLSLCFCH